MAPKAKDLDDLIRLVCKVGKKDGWTVVRTKGRHRAVYHHGKVVAVLPGTGGGGRGVHNARAELKRAGFPFPPR